MALSLDSALRRVCSMHKIDSLKEEQRLCLKILTQNKKDLLACLPTSYGKSLIYQAWPTVCDLLAGKEESIVLVICPLLAIMEEQVNTLQSKGISAAYAGQNDQIDAQISAGHFNVVFGTPETFTGQDKWRRVLQTPVFRKRLVGLAVDEVHTVVQWGHAQGSEKPFRQWCGLVGELRSLLPEPVPLLAITATASKATRQKIMKSLGMQRCVEVLKSPDRDNIRLAVKKVSADPVQTFSWLLKELETKGPECQRTVIYCKTITDCSDLYKCVFKRFLRKKLYHPEGSKDLPENRLVGMYHSETPEDVKQEIVRSLSDESATLRVIIATSALGMGMDLKGVCHVVNYGPSNDLEAYMQAYGRAGRDGSSSHSMILYHGKQLKGISDKMRQYLSNDTCCRRVTLMHLYDEVKTTPIVPKHSCCDFCAKSCNCEESCDGHTSPLEKHAGESLRQRQRVITSQQISVLTERFHDVSEKIASVGAYGPVSVYTTSQCQSNPDDVVKKLLAASPLLFTLEDVLRNVPVSEMSHAESIHEIIQEVFQDTDIDLLDDYGDDQELVQGTDVHRIENDNNDDDDSVLDELGAIGNITIS